MEPEQRRPALLRPTNTDGLDLMNFHGQMGHLSEAWKNTQAIAERGAREGVCV